MGMLSLQSVRDKARASTGSLRSPWWETVTIHYKRIQYHRLSSDALYSVKPSCTTCIPLSSRIFSSIGVIQEPRSGKFAGKLNKFFVRA